MAATITPLPRFDDFIGARTRKQAVTFACDSSYVTGGYPYIKSQFSMTEIEQILQLPLNDLSCEYFLVYDTVNDKMMVYVGDTNDEVANGVDLTSGSTVTFRVTALGS